MSVLGIKSVVAPVSSSASSTSIGLMTSFLISPALRSPEIFHILDYGINDKFGMHVMFQEGLDFSNRWHES